MIKTKPCTVDGCEYPRWAKGFCKAHQYLREDKKTTMNLSSPPAKRKRLQPFSDKKLEELKQYRKVRDEYMSIHKKCEVKGCKNKATDIHHKKGRVGELLSDSNHFLAVCRTCHNRIELNPTWAKDNGYSEDRLS